MSKIFKSVGRYFGQLSSTTSDNQNWKSLRIVAAHDVSNDVLFTKTDRNTITLELTGTIAHRTAMDGIIDHRLTAPGEICLVPAGVEAHFSWQLASGVQHSILAEFDTTLFLDYCPELVSGSFLDGCLVPKNYHPNSEIATLMTMLGRELDPSKRKGSLFSDSVIRLLAIEIATSLWSRKPLPLVPQNTADPRLKRALDYVEAHFRSNVTLHDLSRESGLGITRLTDVFLAMTGSTPYAFVIGRRIQHAVHLLTTTTIPLAYVAFESGFSDQQHMTRLFRKQLGRTPKSFRLAKHASCSDQPDAQQVVDMDKAQQAPVFVDDEQAGDAQAVELLQRFGRQRIWVDGLG